MTENLKRKAERDYKTSKKRYLESLEDLEDTPIKKQTNIKKSEYDKATPNEIIQKIFSKRDINLSSGFSLKHEKKTVPLTAGTNLLKDKILPKLGEIFSKLASIPQRRVELVDPAKSPKKTTENIVISPEIEVKTEEKPIKHLEDCCTPRSKVVRIPESYRRQKKAKSRPRLQINNKV